MVHIFRTHHHYKHDQICTHIYILCQYILYNFHLCFKAPSKKKWSLSTILKFHDHPPLEGHPIFPNRQLAVVRGLELVHGEALG